MAKFPKNARIMSRKSLRDYQGKTLDAVTFFTDAFIDGMVPLALQNPTGQQVPPEVQGADYCEWILPLSVFSVGLKKRTPLC